MLNEISEEEIEKYINDDDWCAQEKFDGVRRLIKKENGSITGINRKGLAVALSGVLQAEMAELPDCILDGEQIGDVLHVFDILSLSNYDLREMSYLYRLGKLQANLPASEYIQIVEMALIPETKSLLYVQLKTANAEGIVFKNIHAKYTPGRPASGGDQLKFKFCATASCIVMSANKTKRSILVGLIDNTPERKFDGDIINVGNATVYPNQDVPIIGDVVEIKYLYAYKGGSLYQPVLLFNRTGEIDAEECVLTQLKYKKDGTE